MTDIILTITIGTIYDIVASSENENDPQILLHKIYEWSYKYKI